MSEEYALTSKPDNLSKHYVSHVQGSLARALNCRPRISSSLIPFFYISTFLFFHKLYHTL